MAALNLSQEKRTVEKCSTTSGPNWLHSLIRICGLLFLAALAATPALAAPCESLSALKLPDTTITSAQPMAAGKFELPSPAPNPPVFKDLPDFCRVTAEIKPAPDSDIKIEVWMP